MTNKQLQQFEREKSAAWNRYFDASRALKPWQFQERAALDAAYRQEHAAIVAKWESMGDPPRISSASELALRLENERLNRIAMSHYERLTGEAQEEIERLQSGIAALREQWQARQDAWQSRFDAEDKPSEYADALTERVYVISVVLEELDALFPPDKNIQQVEES